MPEDVGIDKVEPVDCCRYNNEELEVFIVRLVKIVYAAVGVVGVAFELGGATVDAVEVFILEGRHVGIVVVDEVSHSAQGCVDDGDFPCLAVVDLSGSGNEGEENGLGGVVRCGLMDGDGGWCFDDYLLGNNRTRRHEKEDGDECVAERPRECEDMGSCVYTIAQCFTHVG